MCNVMLPQVNNENGQWMVAAQMCIELGKHLKVI